MRGGRCVSARVFFFFFSFSETGLEGAEPVAEPVSGQGKKGT